VDRKPGGCRLRPGGWSQATPINALVLAVSVALSLSGPSGAQTALPERSAFLAFADFEALLPAEPEAAFDLADALLAEQATPDLRLALAEAALLAGQPARALVYIDGAAEGFASSDARRTAALALEIRALLAQGEGARALALAEARYLALRSRLGEQSPALADEIEALAALARDLGLPEPALIAEERSRLAEEVRVIPTFDSPQAVTVWYGTNRARLDSPDPAQIYTGERGVLEVGRLVVTIPPGHLSGMIERPSSWSLSGRLDPERHVVLAGIERLARERFVEGCCGADDRLLFVHGYNVSFEMGALRAAQLAFDLEFGGQPMYYSWPSKGTVLGYLSDANGVLASRPAMIEFLDLATRGSGTLHIIAHSMGNRYLLEALEIFLRDYPDRKLGQLILGAPDVDQDEMRVRFPILRDHADRVTLYASAGDRALQASRKVNGRPRAGDMEGAPVDLEGLDTVDATPVSADALGHSYFGDAPQVLADILGMIRLDLTPGDRCGTARADLAWVLRPEGCRVEELRVYDDLLRLHGAAAPEAAHSLAEAAAPGDRDFWLAVMALFEAGAAAQP
jgi:esterase/lipase superfamily enzyme